MINHLDSFQNYDILSTCTSRNTTICSKSLLQNDEIFTGGSETNPVRYLEDQHDSPIATHGPFESNLRSATCQPTAYLLHPPLQVFTGGGVDLFAYDRTPEEAVKVSAAAEDAAMAAVGGIAPTQTGHARGELEGRGVKGKTRAGPARGHSGPDSAFSKRGELPQIMARLQLQSHVNQVKRAFSVLCRRVMLESEEGVNMI